MLRSVANRFPQNLLLTTVANLQNVNCETDSAKFFHLDARKEIAKIAAEIPYEAMHAFIYLISTSSIDANNLLRLLKAIKTNHYLTHVIPENFPDLVDILNLYASSHDGIKTPEFLIASMIIFSDYLFKTDDGDKKIIAVLFSCKQHSVEPKPFPNTSRTKVEKTIFLTQQFANERNRELAMQTFLKFYRTVMRPVSLSYTFSLNDVVICCHKEHGFLLLPSSNNNFVKLQLLHVRTVEMESSRHILLTEKILVDHVVGNPMYNFVQTSQRGEGQSQTVVKHCISYARKRLGQAATEMQINDFLTSYMFVVTKRSGEDLCARAVQAAELMDETYVVGINDCNRFVFDAIKQSI